MPAIRGMQADDRKTKELILYLASRSEEDPRFSSTKLNKLLFYCDFTAYLRLGRSMTGQTYQKLPFGPVPKALRPLLEQMKRDQECREVERDYFGLRQRRVQAERPAQLSVFSPEEIELADRILAELWESNATEVSDLSHDFIGWKAAELNEVIPYETVFLGDPSTPVTADEIEFCLQLDREAG